MVTTVLDSQGVEKANPVETTVRYTWRLKVIAEAPPGRCAYLQVGTRGLRGAQASLTLAADVSVYRRLIRGDSTFFIDDWQNVRGWDNPKIEEARQFNRCYVCNDPADSGQQASGADEIPQTASAPAAANQTSDSPAKQGTTPPLNKRRSISAAPERSSDQIEQIWAMCQDSAHIESCVDNALRGEAITTQSGRVHPGCIQMSELIEGIEADIAEARRSLSVVITAESRETLSERIVSLEKQAMKYRERGNSQWACGL